jgi:beta-xylosidase
MKWIDYWPVIGIDTDGNGIGEPVKVFKKPNVGKQFSITSLICSDEFNDVKLGLQWQWHANSKINWGFPSSLGYYMLNCIPKSKEYNNLFDAPNVLLQKFPSNEFTATTKLTFNPHFDNEESGLVIMGLDYCFLSIKQIQGKLFLSQMICKNADKKALEKEIDSVELKSNTIYLKVKAIENGVCSFSFSENELDFKNIGIPFQAKEGKWIGAKLGFVALRDGFINDAGNVKIDWIRFKKI